MDYHVPPVGIQNQAPRDIQQAYVYTYTSLLQFFNSMHQ